MRKIIITDLTRFSEGNSDVCMAGIDIENGECIRPLILQKNGLNRYLTQEESKSHKIFPGSIIQGNFAPSTAITRPHIEDHNWTECETDGHCTSAQFLSILENSKSDSMEEGFGVELESGQKYIDITEANNIRASIITLKLDPRNIRVVKNKFDAKKINVHITDSSGHEFSFLSLTDYGYYNHIITNNAGTDILGDVNKFTRSQEHVYARVGLSRYHEVKGEKAADRKGFWMQVNGIYTFPEYYEQIRSYK